MNMSERQRRVIKAVENLDAVILDVLKDTQDTQLAIDDSPPVHAHLDIREITRRAGILAPPKAMLTRYVLRKLEKEGKVEEVKDGRTILGWRIASSTGGRNDP